MSFKNVVISYGMYSLACGYYLGQQKLRHLCGKVNNLSGNQPNHVCLNPFCNKKSCVRYTVLLKKLDQL